MGKLTVLERPLVRRIRGRPLVVRISEAGVELRGYGCRTWHPVSWERVACLLDRTMPIIMAMETKVGQSKLREIRADRAKEGEQP